MNTFVRRASRIIAAVLVLAAAPACAAPSGLYRGTSGSEPIAACWSADGAEYHVERIGKSVLLEEVDGSADRWVEVAPMFGTVVDFDPAVHTWWELGLEGDTLRGVRHEAGAPDAPLVLHRAATDCAKGYEERRLDRPVVWEPESLDGGIALRAGVHPLTDVRRVALVSGLPATASATINEWLAESGRELDESWTECRDWEGAIATRFVSRRWLVFEISTSGFCGGTHPNEDVSLWAFDGESGAAIDFADWLDASVWKDNRAHGGLRELLRRHIVAVDEDDYCAKHRDAIDAWWFDVAMDDEGFAFVLDETDRAYVACERIIGVPVAEIRAFIAPAHRAEFEAFVSAVAAD